MPFLLDTNVVSVTIKPRPSESVLGWIGAPSPSHLFIAAQTIGEVVRGTRQVKDRARRERFEQWIEEDLLRQFDGRILPFDGRAAMIWGRLMGDGGRAGRTPAAADAQIAAVAIQHELVVVTRSLRDFVRFDIPLLNPWGDSVVR